MESEETVFFQCHYLTITGKQGAGCPARAMNADDCEDAVELGDPTATICSGRHALEKDLLWGPGYWQALWYPRGLTFSVSGTGRTCPPNTDHSESTETKYTRLNQLPNLL